MIAVGCWQIGQVGIGLKTGLELVRELERELDRLGEVVCGSKGGFIWVIIKKHDIEHDTVDIFHKSIAGATIIIRQ